LRSSTREKTIEKEIKILGPEVGYVDILNHETEVFINSENNGQKYYPLRPSASGNCTRELAYALAEYQGLVKYEKKPQTSETHRLLSLGSSIEWHLLRQIEEKAKLIKVKYKQQVVEFYRLEGANAPLIEGSLDAVFFTQDFKAVVDFKSKKDKFHQFARSDWDATTEKLQRMASVKTISSTSFWVEDLEAFLDELNDPYFAANFLQLNGYACTEFLKTRGIDHGAILQYNKNDSRLREVRFKPSDKLYEKIKHKFQVAFDAVAAGNPELAPKDFNLGSTKCAFCPYSQQCWNADTLKPYFETFPKKKWPTKLEKLNIEGLDTMFSAWESGVNGQKEVKHLEDSILKELVARQVTKVELANGSVYDVKHLKSPRPHFELRKGKK
jgi:hypothetical protein